MPLANAPAILNLLDGPVGIDSAFHIVWARFRMMRRYLAYCPEEEPRIFRMLDLISQGTQGHGLVHLDDFWACSAFLFFYFGCLAIQYLC